MQGRARRAFGDTLVSAGVVAMVLAVIVSVDVRVREQLYNAVATTSAPTARSGANALREVGSTIMDSVVAHTIDNAPLVIFGVVAIALLICMVRS
jgi:hypothetical protein